MLTFRKFEKTVNSLNRSQISRAILTASQSAWVMNAGIIVRESHRPGQNNVKTNRLFGLTYLYKGSGHLIYDNKKRLYVQPGCVFLRLPNRSVQVIPTFKEKWISIMFSIPSPYWEAMKMTTPGIQNKLVWDAGLPLTELDQILSVIAKLPNQDEIGRFKSLSTLLEVTLKLTLASSSSAPTESSASIERIRRHLKDTGNPPIPIPTLTKKFGLSYEVCRKSFKERFGESPSDFRTRHRMAKACELLASTKLSISEISDRLHYSSIHAFSKQFALFNKCSPTEFRKNSI